MMRAGPAPAPGHGGQGARDPRQYNYYSYRTQGPSPWFPATILGVMVLITVMPYMRRPEAAIAYHPATAVRTSSRFPSAALWIPVLSVIALQFFAGQWHHDGYGRPGYRSRSYGGVPGANAIRGGGLDRMGADYYQAVAAAAGWGGTSWWPRSSSSSSLWNPSLRYNIHQQRGLVSTFMDYGGHWLLIVLGIALFTLVSASSLPPTQAVPLAPLSWGFPWSLLL